ncbi:MAG: PEP-utilizing enzyme [Acidimicrobiales bacterium]
MNDRFPFWTRANVGEVLPEPPSPLGWDLVWETGTLEGWRHCYVERLGMGPDELSPGRPEVTGMFGGYAYLGATATRIWAERTPGMDAGMIDAAYYGDHPDVPPYVAEPWHHRPETTTHMEGWLGWVMGSFDQSELQADRVTADAARASRPDLTAASDADLIARARSFAPTIKDMFSQHINQSGAASIGPGTLGAIATAMGDPTLTLRLIGGLGDVDSAAPSYAMWELSRTVRSSATLRDAFGNGHQGLTAWLRTSDDPDVRAFVADLDAFLAEFGSRGPNEWDIHSDVWETKPDLVLALVDRMRLAPDDAAPGTSHAAREAEREALVSSVNEALAGDPETQGLFNAAITSAKTFVPGRERSKTSIIKVIHEVRMAVFELGRRAVAAGALAHPADICLLFDDELEAFMADPTSFADTIAERQAHLEHLKSIEPPFIINETVPPIDTWPQRADHGFSPLAVGEVLAGLPGCSGTYRGTARVILDPSEPGDLDHGDVLIAPHTDPAWTPLFVAAGAVVVNVGAALSHAIIVSRELGLPCVVSATDATMRIPDGAEIEVNGDTGAVTVVSLP